MGVGGKQYQFQKTRAWPKSSKVQRKDLRNEMFVRDFVKLQHIPGVIEECVHMRSCVNAQGRPEKALISHL